MAYSFDGRQNLYDELTFIGIRDLISWNVVGYVQQQLIEVSHFKELVERNQLQTDNSLRTDCGRRRSVGESAARSAFDVFDLLLARIGHSIWQRRNATFTEHVISLEVD